MFSVGTDLVEVERIKKSAESPRFKERVYSKKECGLFLNKKDPYESMAGNWAAKEAFAKAVKTGVRDFSMNEISVLRDENGAPYLELTGNAKKLADSLGLDFEVSITHTKGLASAVVLAYSRNSHKGADDL